MAQITQTATDSPPAKAGAHPMTVSMAGVKADTAEANAAANSGGTQGASQSGTRTACIAPEPPARTSALETVHAVTAWKAQAVSDQSAKRLNTTNQLSA